MFIIESRYWVYECSLYSVFSSFERYKTFLKQQIKFPLMTLPCLQDTLKHLSLLPYLSALDHQVPYISKHTYEQVIHIFGPSHSVCLKSLSSTDEFVLIPLRVLSHPSFKRDLTLLFLRFP